MNYKPSSDSASSKSSDVYNDPTCINAFLNNCYSRTLPSLALTPSSKRADPFEIEKWHFTCLDFSLDEIISLIEAIFDLYIRRLKISKTDFDNFIKLVLANYPSNPYHSIYHAVDVLQCAYYIMKVNISSKSFFETYLSDFEQFSVLIACLCHDLGHPGLTNQFLVNVDHPLRILYNDLSILEQYHSTVLFCILSDPLAAPILQNFSRTDREGFREMIIRCIFATDMKNHFDIIEKFASIIPSSDCRPDQFSRDQKVQLGMSVVKISDLCNLLRPFSIAKEWSLKIREEFCAQVYLQLIL